MDKPIIDRRPEIRDYRQFIVCGLQSAVCIFTMLALFPIMGYAADSTQSDSSTPFSRSVAAGKAVSKRALSSRETVTTPVAETNPTVAAAPSSESMQFQRKMANLSQEKPTQDKLIEASVRKEAPVTAVPKPEEPKPIKRNIVGTVTGINDQGIAIEYASSAEKGGMEYWINFDKKVQKAGGLKGVSGLEVGDKVSAIYNEYPNKAKKLTEITLRKKKTKETEEA